MSENVENVAKIALQKPIKIMAKDLNKAADVVNQRLLFVGEESAKLRTIRQLLRNGHLEPPVLIFAQSKNTTQHLHRQLLFEGISVDTIHADQPQTSRNTSIENFNNGKTWVLIATDLAGRGMNFPRV